MLAGVAIGLPFWFAYKTLDLLGMHAFGMLHRAICRGYTFQYADLYTYGGYEPRHSSRCEDRSTLSKFTYRQAWETFI